MVLSVDRTLNEFATKCSGTLTNGQSHVGTPFECHSSRGRSPERDAAPHDALRVDGAHRVVRVRLEARELVQLL